jgi:hypothetical protein
MPDTSSVAALAGPGEERKPVVAAPLLANASMDVSPLYDRMIVERVPDSLTWVRSHAVRGVTDTSAPPASGRVRADLAWLDDHRSDEPETRSD